MEENNSLPAPVGSLGRRTFVAAALSFLIASECFASGAGSTGANILSMPVGTRAVGMGEAYTAQADDVSSLYWNPAGIAILNQSQASFMRSQWLDGLTYSQASVATPLENGGIGASFSYLSYGTIQGYDLHDQPTGNVDAYTGVATLGGGWLGDFWSAGLNLKGIRGDLAGVTATGLAADLGLTVFYPHEVAGGTIRAAATLRHLGTGLKYIEQNDPLPVEFRLGLAAVRMMDDRLNLALDLGKKKDDKTSLYAGTEFWLLRYVALRAGYAGGSSESSGLRAGLGLRVKNLTFDYAYSPYGELGMTNRYELTVRFGAVRPLLTPEERAILRRAKLAMRQQRYDEAVLLLDSLIRLVPQYKPTYRLIKTAMKGVERQEALAKNSIHYKEPAVSSLRQPVSDDDVAEIEKLLTDGDTHSARTAQAPKGAAR